MAFFSAKKEEVFNGGLGVDLGTVGIKMVELVDMNGRMTLSTYGYAESRVVSAGPYSPLDDLNKTAQIMKNIIKEANIKSKRVVAALPPTKVFHAIISLPVPKDPKEDLRPFIEAQAEKLLPMPLDKMVLDTSILDKHLLNPISGEAQDNSDKYMRILLTGAPKDLISSYIELFSKLDLELVSLETEVFALIRSLIGQEKAHCLLLDLGADRTSLAVVKEGIPLLTRVLKNGGQTVTQALANSLHVAFSEAEAMKRDLSFAGGGSLPPVLLESLKPMVHEIRYALQLYKDQEGAGVDQVEKILLTGGGAHLPGLSELLSRELDMNVYVSDPWARVAAQSELRGILEELGPRFAVAIGLAERLFERSA